MPLFTSSREKRLWSWAFVVFAAIFSTLFLGQPLAELFNSQDVRAVIFLIVMFFVGATILVHAIKTKPTKTELTIVLGIVAVYTMLVLRLGMPERSHLMEYSVLAIFIHKAILERKNQGKQIHMPALIAFMVTFVLGVMDECIQIFLPNRIFDPADILFNSMAAAMAIGFSMFLLWARKWKKKSKTHTPNKN
jgi:hypothetical protein